MGDTVREKIMQNLKTVLEGITVANGYNKTINSVQRYERSGNSVATSAPCIVIIGGEETCFDEPNPYMTCKMETMLEVWFHDDETSSDPTDKTTNAYLGDIKKCLRTGSNHTLSGYSQDINIVRSIPFEGYDGKSLSGVLIELEIIYRHLQNNPETAG